MCYYNCKKKKILQIKLSSHYSRVRITLFVKFVIKTPLSQMEVCQTGYYMDDFRTQEVPAGFDFASFGEFRLLQDSLYNAFSSFNIQSAGPDSSATFLIRWNVYMLCFL